MGKLTIVVGLAIGTLGTLEAKADGLLARLPEDGAWIRYETLMVDKDGEFPGHLIIRSVGRAAVDGEECRWIEFQFESNDLNAIAKLLIPESHLHDGQEPASHVLARVVRGWFKLGNGATKRIEDPTTLGLLPYFLPGPLQEYTQVTVKRVVQGSRGKLECEARKGRLRTKFKRPNGQMREEEVSYEFGFHEEVPFGVAFAAWAIKVENKGRWETAATVTISVADSGKSGTSRLPEFQ